MGAEATFAAAGLQVGGELIKGLGAADSYRYQEAKAQRTAQAARTAADETSAALQDELNTTLGNIAAIRAAAGGSASPTEDVLLQHQAEVSGRQQRIKIGNLNAQAAQAEEDAKYYRFAAGMALPAAGLSAFGSGLKTLSGTGR